MNAQRIHLTLLDGSSVHRIDQVSSLVAQDASGQFGLLPGHVALVTVLEPGLFRYKVGEDETWVYGASAGGVLHCEPQVQATEVRVVSRRFLWGDEPEALQERLNALLSKESTLRVSTRDSIAQLDQAFYKRMQRLSEMTTNGQE